MEFRLLQTNYLSAFDNMAIDEAVLTEIASGNSPATLRLYGWKPAAISIGYFQRLNEEVDTEACEATGVDVVRRITGGGAVLHEHEITYSIHMPEKSGIVPPDILKSYEAICNGVIHGLGFLGIPSLFAPINDIVTHHNGALRKISGNAQTRKQGIILQHGTILLRVDVEKMFSLLKVPGEKLKGKLIADVKERVTSASDLLGREVSFLEASQAMIQGFEKAFPGQMFQDGELSEKEKSFAMDLKKEKYDTNEWNNQR